MINNFDITTIENAFKVLVKNGGVSSTIYTNRPKSATTADDFVVVLVSSNVRDMDTYGTATIGIHLFAKDVHNQKNTVKLGVMYGKLLQAIPAEFDKYVVDMNPVVLPDVADDFGFHARMIDFEITIKNR